MFEVEKTIDLFKALQSENNDQHTFERYYSSIANNATNMHESFAGILEGEVSEYFPYTSLDEQLEAIFKLTLHRDEFGHSVQCFSCNLGRFDTHSN